MTLADNLVPVGCIFFSDLNLHTLNIKIQKFKQILLSNSIMTETPEELPIPIMQ